MIQSINSHMYKNLTAMQVYIIGDKLFEQTYNFNLTNNIRKKKYHFQNYVIMRFYKKFYKFLKKIDKKIKILEPQNKLVTIINFLNLLSLIQLFFIFTIKVSLQTTKFISSYNIQIYISIFFVILNSLMNLNTGFYQKGIVCKERYQILQYYKSQYLFKDLLFLLSVVFLSMESQNAQLKNINNWFQLILIFILLIKLQDFNQIINKFEQIFLLKQKTQNIISLMKLFSFIIFFLHLICCLWLYVSFLNPNMNWLSKLQIQDQEWHVKYIYSFYFSTTTLTTVGFGDIQPSNIQEATCCVFIMLFCCGTYGFILNQVGSILQEFNQDEKQMKLKFDNINQYMSKKNISNSLKNEIREYLEYVWTESNQEMIIQSKEILNQLNENLYNNFQYEQNKTLIKYFEKYFSKDFTEQINSIIQEKQTNPKEIIYENGQIDDQSIYFIEKGYVEIYLKNEKKILKVIFFFFFFDLKKQRLSVKIIYLVNNNFLMEKKEILMQELKILYIVQKSKEMTFQSYFKIIQKIMRNFYIQKIKQFQIKKQKFQNQNALAVKVIVMYIKTVII
ncbi:hypothetical protein IMG5_002400 [Ichthyophthirius multifiliis]|uniref:Potassium channel domain-containing protein n=1 Tax=Ichthyophthirius multifiliis TaxID=5932 RepID=G0QJ44_ICHMU|nr:hypothetical protein IMG5_002400 [Ichthyophthirius multifiliis]EGR34768.1 hypothetical protein IMG5_002400 [Ichthyophthirius multifiliis]|eukprot:XP_004040072.1 hypothetical protein IMG5_002400 [Ichthyophthirius multifiliis]